ncbi:hypothetical protein [Kribbella sp. CA-247076]|uniref:hypothetical protein n=1 Tax=Kribbella sp. CA-247076 TaxID=3239941 RepID=UPI003D8FCAC1
MHTTTKTSLLRSEEASKQVGGSGRWAAISGIGFVVLMLVGSMLVGDVPLPDAPVQEITDYLADTDRQMGNLIGAYSWVVGSLLFLLFAGRLRSELRSAEGGAGTLSNVNFAAGAAFSAVWAAAAGISGAIPFAIAVRGAPAIDPDLVRVLPAAGRFLLLLGGGFTGALFLVTAAVVIFRTGVFQRWLGGLGIVAAVALLFDIVYLNITPFWAWVLVTAVVMLTRRPKPTTPTPDAA